MFTRAGQQVAVRRLLKQQSEWHVLRCLLFPNINYKFRLAGLAGKPLARDFGNFSTAWDPPTLDSFSLSAGTIYQNESVTASWSSTGANACHLSTGGGARSPNSSATFPAWSFSPGTIGGSMHCTGYGGTSNSLSVSLTVLAWVDTDGDGVHNDRDSDDDGDGMPDRWENANGLDPLASNANGDPDGDGDSNLTEYRNGTDPQDHETPRLLSASLSKSRIYDNESVTFTWNSKYATACRPIWVSSGASGASDWGPRGTVTYRGADFSPGTHTYEFYCTGGGKESARRTISLTVVKWIDTDGDGIHDDLDTDDDGDGMPDVWENDNDLDPLVDDASADPDGDGDSNLTEYNNGTDPQDHETPQLLSASLSASRIYENESVTFTWRSRYATVCHDVNVGGGAAGGAAGTGGARPPSLRSLLRGGAGGASGAADDWAPNGEEPFAANRFEPGDYEYEFYCTGGGKESNRETIRLTVLAWVDTDGDGVHNDEDEDDDGDGLPDVWENANGLDPLVDDAAADPDGDKDSNLTEYGNGTNPQTHEVAQLLDFRLLKASVFSDEAAAFDWNSRYATACRFADDTVNLGTSGPLTSDANEFAAGTWTISMYCTGPGGNSPAQSVTLTVTDRPASPEPPVESPATAEPGEFTGDYRLFRLEIDAEDDGGGTLARQHLVVRNANPGTNPPIRDFAMKESSTSDDFHLYSMDAAWLAPYVDQITAMTTRPVVGDYNHDGYADLGIVDLSGEPFPGVDRIVYADPGEAGYVPARAAKLDGNAKDFFSGLSNWLGGLSAIEDDFSIEYRVGGGENAQAAGGAQGAAGARPRIVFELDRAALLPLGADRRYTDPRTPPPASALPAACKQRLRFCSMIYVPSGENELEMTFDRADFPGRVREPRNGASGANAAVVLTWTFRANEVIAVSGGWVTVLVDVLINWWPRSDNSVGPSLGERDAALLWETILRRVGNSGMIEVGSPAAAKLEAALEAYLGAEVLEGALTDVSLAELPELIEQAGGARTGVLGDILTVLEHVRGRMALPPKLAPQPLTPPGTVVCEGSHCIPIGCDADGNCLNEACEASEAGASGTASDDGTARTCLSEIDIVEICRAGKARPGMRDDPRYRKFCDEDGAPIGIQVCSIEITSLASTDDFTIRSGGNSPQALFSGPVMPRIRAEARTVPANAEVTWRASISYQLEEPEYCSGATYPIDSPEVEDEGHVLELGADAFKGIYGGDLTVTASCSATGMVGSRVAAERKITGQEPTPAQKNRTFADFFPGAPFIRGLETGRPNSGEQEISDLKRLACAESDITQFQSGLPHLGASSDAGLMQICSEQTASVFWNYRANVDKGAQILSEKVASARRWLNTFVNDSENRFPLATITDDALRKESLFRYKWGNRTDSKSFSYLQWNNERQEWEPIPGGENDNRGDYMDHELNGILYKYVGGRCGNNV